MTHVQGLRAAAAAAAAAVLLGACGGGGGGPALSHAQLVARAGGLCRDARTKATNLNPSSPDYIQKAIAQAEDLVRQLSGLTPSPADADSYMTMLDAFDKAIADVGQGDFKDAAAQQTTFVHAADRLGLSDCTNAALGG